MSEQKERSLRVRRLRLRGDVEAVRELISLLDDPEAEGHAAVALSQLKAVTAVPALTARYAEAEDWRVRCFYLDILGSIGAPESLPVFLECLKDGDPRVVKEACSALGELKSAPEAAVGELLELLGHPEWEVCAAACSSLVDLGASAPAVSSTIDRLAADPRAHAGTLSCLRYEWAKLTGRLEEFRETERAENLVLARSELQSDDQEVRRRGVQRLKGVDGDEALALLSGAFQDPSIWVRSAVPMSLTVWQGATLIPGLIHHLRHDESPRVRQMCAYVLQFQKDPRVLEPLVEALGSDNDHLIVMAVISLAELGNATAIPRLLPLLAHADWHVRLHTCNTLLELGAAELELVTTLEQLAREPEAEEWDLSMAEQECDREEIEELAVEMGDPGTRTLLPIQEMVAKARALLSAPERESPSEH